MERLHVVIARAGLSSRKGAERLIAEGRVTVNGEVINRMGVKVDPARDHIKVDGKLIRVRDNESRVYIMLNKPRGYITTRNDPQGRPTVFDLMNGVKAGLHTVGRLDRDSEGLLILTNDGRLTQKIAHPGGEVPKTYHVKVRGIPDLYKIAKIKKGVFIDGKRRTPLSVKSMEGGRVNPVRMPVRGLKSLPGYSSKKSSSSSKSRSGFSNGVNSWWEIKIKEGRNREVRRIFSSIGHPVLRLKRVRIGDLNIGSLSLGSFRYLKPQEIRFLTTQ